MESKEREAYRMKCRYYGVEGNCHKQSRTFFTRSEISDTELKIHMIANCTPHSICERMRRYDKKIRNEHKD